MVKFILYEKARYANREVVIFIGNNKIPTNIANQLSRASTSIVLNVAEGNARVKKNDRNYFFTISRGSSQECIAIFDILEDQLVISNAVATKYRENFVEVIKIVSKIVFKDKLNVI